MIKVELSEEELNFLVGWGRLSRRSTGGFGKKNEALIQKLENLSSYKALRPCVKDYAEAVEQAMRRNDEEKGDSWKRMSIEELRVIVSGEYKEWAEAIDKFGEIIEMEELDDLGASCAMLRARLHEEIENERP